MSLCENEIGVKYYVKVLRKYFFKIFDHSLKVYLLI